MIYHYNDAYVSIKDTFMESTTDSAIVILLPTKIEIEFSTFFFCVARSGSTVGTQSGMGGGIRIVPNHGNSIQIGSCCFHKCGSVSYGRAMCIFRESYRFIDYSVAISHCSTIASLDETNLVISAGYAFMVLGGSQTITNHNSSYNEALLTKTHASALRVGGFSSKNSHVRFCMFRNNVGTKNMISIGITQAGSDSLGTYTFENCILTNNNDQVLIEHHNGDTIISACTFWLNQGILVQNTYDYESLSLIGCFIDSLSSSGDVIVAKNTIGVKMQFIIEPLSTELCPNPTYRFTSSTIRKIYISHILAFTMFY